MSFQIPDLPIEDYDKSASVVEDKIKDESGGALTYAFIGAGQGGGRMSKAFYDLLWRAGSG